MLCPKWRKNSGRNYSNRHAITKGAGLVVPTAIKEENRSPSSIEDCGGSGSFVNVGVKTQAPPERGGTEICRGSCEVTLRRKSGDTLGLGIAGGSDKGCPPTISCLRPGGIAHRSDCLLVGDLITAVNGISVTSLRHEDILTLLRNAGEQVTLSIEYDLNHACFDRPLPSTTINKTCLVKLEKEGGGLGLTIRGGAYGPDASKSRLITVTAIRAGGPAHRDGRIRMGDRLSAINGLDVTTATLRTALSHIDRSNECVLTVEYDVSLLEAIHNAHGPLLLEIDKPAGEELGVILNVEEVTHNDRDEQTSTSRKLYVIGSITTASIADRCGALFVGDQLLSVDSVTLEYTTLAEVYQLLKGNSNSQNIRVEIVPRYLRGFYSQSDRNTNSRQDVSIPMSRQSSLQEGLPEYARIVKNGNGSFAVRGLGPNVDSALFPSSKSTPAIHGQPMARSFQKQEKQRNGPTSSSVIYHSRNHGTNNENGKKLSEKEMRQLSKDSHARGRKSSKQQHQLFSVPQLVSSASEKCKKSDRRHASGSSKINYNGRGRSASAVGLRQGTPIHDLLPLSSGSLTASVSAVPCGQVCHSEVMEVVLNCWARGGYGLILHRNNQSAGNQQPQSPLFISYIERGSPADKSGVLQIGDRILAINDWCTSNGTPEEANQIIRQATGPLTLTIEFDVIETVLPSSGVFTVKLAKRGQNLGIVLQTCATNQKGDPIMVSDVRTGSVAHRCGSIHVGDQILAIDNIPLDSCTTEEASRLLQRSSDIVKLRIKKNLCAIVDEYDTSSTTANGSHVVVYTVELSRKNGPLGLTIAGQHEGIGPIFISQIAPGGLAERTGAVHAGDQVIAINGQTLHGKRLSEALQIFHAAGELVSLKVARYVAPILSSLATTPNRHAHPNSLFHSASCNAPGSPGYMQPLVTLAGGILDRQTVFHDPYHERDASDKLGTPVQSIDSAVESLEDSPLNDSQHPSSSSNRTSQNSKSSSLSGAVQSDNGGTYVEDLSNQLHRTLSALKTGGSSTSQGSRQSDTGSSNVSNSANDDDPHYAQLGGDGCPCQTHRSVNNQSQEDWIRVLEALETVGEAEMLKKLEETILAGNVPSCGHGAQNVDGSGSLLTTSQPSLKAPPKPPMVPPFPLTNTILRHPYSNSRSMSTSSTTQKQDGLYASISSTKYDVPKPNVSDVQSAGQSHLLSISTIFNNGWEHIPFITTPVPASATPKSTTQSIATTSTSTATTIVPNGNHNVHMAPNRFDRSNSPTSSSIQLSGSATPSAEVAIMEHRETATGTSSALNSMRQSTSAVLSNATASNRVPLEIYRVTLAKDKVYNDFGFSVSDGVQDKGVYINKIRAGGPADVSGNIKPFDRILQVNGTSLKDLDCMLAVPLLSSASDRIDLLLCRDPFLAASFRGTESILEEDEETVSLLGQTTV